MELTPTSLRCAGPKDLKPLAHRRVARLRAPHPIPTPGWSTASLTVL